MPIAVPGAAGRGNRSTFAAVIGVRLGRGSGRGGAGGGRGELSPAVPFLAGGRVVPLAHAGAESAQLRAASLGAFAITSVCLILLGRDRRDGRCLVGGGLADGTIDIVAGCWCGPANLMTEQIGGRRGDRDRLDRRLRVRSRWRREYGGGRRGQRCPFGGGEREEAPARGRRTARCVRCQHFCVVLFCVGGLWCWKNDVDAVFDSFVRTRTTGLTVRFESGFFRCHGEAAPSRVGVGSLPRGTINHRRIGASVSDVGVLGFGDVASEGGAVLPWLSTQVNHLVVMIIGAGHAFSWNAASTTRARSSTCT